MEAGGLALSALSGRREPATAGKRLGGQSGVPDVFPMRGAVPEGALALSDLHGGPAAGEPGTETTEGGNVEIGKAADEPKALRLAVARDVQNFTERTGIVISLDVRPVFREEITFDAPSGTERRLICYLADAEIKALTSRKAAG